MKLRSWLRAGMGIVTALAGIAVAAAPAGAHPTEVPLPGGPTVSLSIDSPVVGASLPPGPVTVTGTATIGEGNSAELTSLFLHDRIGPFTPITDATPALPEPGPATVTYTATTDPLPAGAHNLCVFVGARNDSGAISFGDCHDVTVTEPPQVDAGGPYAGQEGEPVELTGSVTDPDGPDATVDWSPMIANADDGTGCDLADPAAVATTVTCTDDGIVELTLTADDGAGPPVSDSATLTLSNAAPDVDIAAPAEGSVVATGAPVEFEAPFTDPGRNDTHSCTVDFGDGTPMADGAVDQSAGSGTCRATHTFTAGGSYDVRVTVVDDDGGAATAVVRLTVSAPPAPAAGEAFAINAYGLLTVPKSPHATCPPDEALTQASLDAGFAVVTGLNADCTADPATGETVATASVDKVRLFGGSIEISDIESRCESNADGKTGTSRVGTINGTPIGAGAGSFSITPAVTVHYNETITDADGDELVQNAIRVKTVFGLHIILAGCRVG